jgi:anti-anti-sigma factor
MNITPIQRTGWLELKLEGRLDASWSEHLVNTIAANIREGRHDIRIDANNLEYLSSAGLRALLRAHKDLTAVSGTFAIIRASDFVVKTLSMSGFGSLLALETESEKAAVEAAPEKSVDSNAWKKAGVVFEKFELDAEATLDATIVGTWTPWGKATEANCSKVQLGSDTIALGIGAPGDNFDAAGKVLGDFLAASGCVAWLPGTGADAPDYLVQEGRFVPEIVTASGIRATGAFSHLFRFKPEEDADAVKFSGLMDETMKRVKPANSGASLSLSGLMDAVLATTNSTAAAFVALAEVDGLVGVATARSPGLISGADKPSQFPDVRDWLSFSGERVHNGAQALVVGFIDATKSGREISTLPSLPSRDGWKAHVHAAVFPFKPLPNGKIFMADTVQQLFAGAEPQALLHLVEDSRPTLGLGESAFVRGACWCAGAHFITETK